MWIRISPISCFDTLHPFKYICVSNFNFQKKQKTDMLVLPQNYKTLVKRWFATQPSVHSLKSHSNFRIQYELIYHLSTADYTELHYIIFCTSNFLKALHVLRSLVVRISVSRLEGIRFDTKRHQRPMEYKWNTCS